MDVLDIVAEYLKAHGYDGLVSPCDECACEIENLAPCGERIDQCRPGYKVPCDCGEHDFHISTIKQQEDE